jgi:hypothetical protein
LVSTFFILGEKELGIKAKNALSDLIMEKVAKQRSAVINKNFHIAIFICHRSSS